MIGEGACCTRSQQEHKQTDFPYTLMNISIVVYTFIQLPGSLEADF